jgi:hypothetical protein
MDDGSCDADATQILNNCVATVSQLRHDYSTALHKNSSFLNTIYDQDSRKIAAK